MNTTLQELLQQVRDALQFYASHDAQTVKCDGRFHGQQFASSASAYPLGHHSRFDRQQFAEYQQELAAYRGSPDWEEVGEDSRGNPIFSVSTTRAEKALGIIDAAIEALAQQAALSRPASVDTNMQESEREKFEKWWRDRFDVPGYIALYWDNLSQHDEIRFEAFCAALSQPPAVQVPEKMPYGAFDNRFQDGWNACRKAMLDTATSPAEQVPQWECAARRSATPEPQDCNWPVCGCDPYADKVIAALEDYGALSRGNMP